jgi:hypothetical protein
VGEKPRTNLLTNELPNNPKHMPSNITLRRTPTNSYHLHTATPHTHLHIPPTHCKIHTHDPTSSLTSPTNSFIFPYLHDQNRALYIRRKSTSSSWSIIRRPFSWNLALKVHAFATLTLLRLSLRPPTTPCSQLKKHGVYDIYVPVYIAC